MASALDTPNEFARAIPRADSARRATIGEMTWTVPAPAPVDGPLTGPDGPILQGFLAWQRSTLLNICAGLTAEQLAARPLESSTLSLLGLIRHLGKVERIWFRQRAAGQSVPPLFEPVPGREADFEDLDPARAVDDVARYEQECREADRAVAGLPLDTTFDVHGEPFSLRAVYLHMISEYSRHNGHADLLRERLDGVRGR